MPYGEDYPDAGQGAEPGGIVHDSPPEQSPPTNRGHLVRLSDVTPEQVAWLWEGRLPVGKLVLLDGDPSLGKSTLGLTFAAHVSTGKPWPDGAHCEPGDVVLMSAEDGLSDTVRPRLDAAGGDPARVHALTEIRYVDQDGKVSSRPPTLADTAVLRELVTSVQAKLLIVDVLMAYLAKSDAHRDQDMRTVLHPVAQLAEDTGCTVLLLRHLNKATGGSAMYRGGGSIGIVGAARAAFLVAPDPDDESGQTRVLASIKSNLAVTPPAMTYRLESAPDSHVARVVWLGESAHRADSLLSAPADAEERTERDEAADWLVGYLADNGGTAERKNVFKAARAAGFSEATLKRAKDKARVKHESSGFPRTTVWMLDPVSSVSSHDPQQKNCELTEPTEPTGLDQRKHDDDSGQSAQSAQSVQLTEPEPTEPTGHAQLALAAAKTPCDQCGNTPTKINGAGARYCHRCAPTLWRTAS